MKISKRIFIVLVCISLFPVYLCFADNDIFTYKTGIIEKDGNLCQHITIQSVELSNFKGKSATLLVWNTEKVNSLDKIIYIPETDTYITTNLDEMNLFSAVMQSKVDNNGTLVFRFLLDNSVKKTAFNAEIQIENEAEKFLVRFDVLDISQMNDIMIVINDREALLSLSALELKDKFGENIEFIIDTSVYDEIINQQEIWHDILEGLIVNKNNGGTNNLDYLTCILKKEILLNAFALSDDPELLNEAINLYETDILNLKSQSNAKNIYNTYLTLNEDKRKEVIKLIGKTSYEDITSIVSAFNEKVFITAVNNVLYYSHIDTIINNNADYLGFSESELNVLQNEYKKKNILKKVFTQRQLIKTVQSFKEIYKAAVTKYDDLGSSEDNEMHDSSRSQNYIISNPESSAELPKTDTVNNQIYFNDIAEHWSYEAVMYLAKKQIIHGKAEKQFIPNDNITRAEFIKILFLTFDLYNEKAQIDFRDVFETDWYYSYVASAFEKNIVKGYGDKMFKPNENISREEMATIIYRVLECKGLQPTVKEYELKFEDSNEIAEYAQNGVAVLSNVGIIKGSDGKFIPKSKATRAEAAQIIYSTAKEVGLLNDKV